MTPDTSKPEATLFGHPTGLYNLFFAEMWERFSYYGMRALLTFYMIKATFLRYPDKDAYAVYGAYTALVYMTPFFGGMIADRLLGQRKAVILGGALMAAGHLLMSVENSLAFFMALGLLIAGNGFFKPNISTIVGGLYKHGDERRDGGFTIFYMGINLGAALAPLLCGYIGETYGWHYGFNLATLGMLIGLAVFWAPTRIAQFLVLVGALGTSGTMIYLQRNSGALLLSIYGLLAVALVAAGLISTVALNRGGIPEDVGHPPNPEELKKPGLAGISKGNLIYLGSLIAVPLFALLVSANRQFTIIPSSMLEKLKEGGGFGEIASVVLGQMSTPGGLLLAVAGIGSLTFLLKETLRLDKVAKERMYVVLVLTFFSFLFWAFFEQAGSSINNFTDRNVDRVFEERQVEPGEVGSVIELEPNQEQLGHKKDDHLFNMTELTEFREAAQNGDGPKTTAWKVQDDNVGMGIGGNEIKASVFQSANPIFILIFGLVFTWLWGFLAARGWEPSTPFKFSLGLLQLGLGFGALWFGAQNADARGMVSMSWLLLGYLLHTTGELCLSPVGLSMVTKLSPQRLVSTVMGSWFLATALSNFLAAVIAQFTGVGEGGAEGSIPPPQETVDVYGGVYGKIAIAGIVAALICFGLVPMLRRWMHNDED